MTLKRQIYDFIHIHVSVSLSPARTTRSQGVTSLRIFIVPHPDVDPLYTPSPPISRLYPGKGADQHLA